MWMCGFSFKIDAAKGGERQLLCCGPFQFGLLFIVLLLFPPPTKGAGSTALPASTRNNVRWFKNDSHYGAWRVFFELLWR